MEIQMNAKKQVRDIFCLDHGRKWKMPFPRKAYTSQNNVLTW